MTAPNQTTPPPQTALTIAPKREIRVVENDSPSAYMLDTAQFEHCSRIAEAMARASLLPKHLKGDGSLEQARANCFMVVNQAMAWKLNPFLIMGETYEVQNKLGFQGKLIIAVMNTRAGLREKLRFDFNDKKGDELAVTVTGRFIGEDLDRAVTVAVGQVKTQNQMWTKDPEQKLIYTAAIRWARRYAPEVVMGVMIEEDMEAIREEAHIASLKQIKSPVFDGPPPEIIVQPASTAPLTEPQVEKAKTRGKRPTMVEEPLDQKPATVQAEPATNPTAAPAAVPDSTAVPPTPPANETPGEKELRELNENLTKLCADAGITEEQLILYMRNEKWMREKHQKPRDIASGNLKAFVKGWQANTAEMVKRIKGAVVK